LGLALFTPPVARQQDSDSDSPKLLRILTGRASIMVLEVNDDNLCTDTPKPAGVLIRTVIRDDDPGNQRSMCL
jgi:hypothetical protein